ncbi:hypothetical protein [Dethiothermospora halolimnae]|uniref:hypothetical protein n=1 Tax=Dethiothermospora halolimnae TaxID=3114390 RepID=UPI003CCBF16D
MKVLIIMLVICTIATYFIRKNAYSKLYNLLVLYLPLEEMKKINKKARRFDLGFYLSLIITIISVLIYIL